MCNTRVAEGVLTLARTLCVCNTGTLVGGLTLPRTLCVCNTGVTEGVDSSLRVSLLKLEPCVCVTGTLEGRTDNNVR